MSIITISRGSHSRGSEVAFKIADSLGYDCISREILIEASELFNISEIKLVKAIHDAPSILERFNNGKERYIAYIKAALLRYIQKDNVVYHGLAGHFFLQDIPHVLKIRIIADLEDRIKEEIKRENISSEKARYNLKKDDDERRKWGISLYGIDTWEPSLYDMVLHIKTLKVDDAVKIILDMVKLPSFKTTSESKKILDDLVLSAQIEAILVDEFPRVKAFSKDGEVCINITQGFNMVIPNKNDEIINKIKEIAINVGGAKKVKINLI